MAKRKTKSYTMYAVQAESDECLATTIRKRREAELRQMDVGDLVTSGVKAVASVDWDSPEFRSVKQIVERVRDMDSDLRSRLLGTYFSKMAVIARQLLEEIDITIDDEDEQGIPCAIGLVAGFGREYTCDA